MRAHDGAIEHQVTVVAILCQRCEDPLPYPGVRPPAEALMYRLPLAIALRQVTPVRARPKHPQTTVYEQAVVRPATSRITRLAREQRFDPQPLFFTQLVSLDPITWLRA